MATSIFSIINGLTVDKSDILEAELFTEQFLSAQFPTYDFRQGTALRDMTVRPNATLLALVNKAIKHYFDDSDISSITNATDPDLVEKRLSNFFIERKTGNSAVLKARLYFAFPTVNPVTTVIPSSAYFSIDNNTKYNPSGPIAINPDPGALLRDPTRYYFQYDRATNRHYVDINLVSQLPSTEANIDEGDLLYFTLFSPYFIGGEILYKIQDAVDTETNEQMVERAYSSISTRNLINSPSIEASISDQFNFVGEIYPVGLGSDDLYRDLITIEVVDDEGDKVNQTYHRGGHVDVYIDTPKATQRVQLTLGDELTTILQGPVVGLRRAPVAQSGKDPDLVPQGVDFSYQTVNVSKYDEFGVPLEPEKDLSLSTEQQMLISVPLSAPGDTISFDIDTYSGLASVNNAIKSKEQRVVCADYLVRSFTPVYVDIALEVRGTADEEATIENINAYINSIPSGGVFYMSNLVDIIQESGVINFVMPITVNMREEHRFRQYDSADSSVTDCTTINVTDFHNIRPTQMFKIGEVTLTEV